MMTRKNGIRGLMFAGLIAMAMLTDGFQITAEGRGGQDTEAAITADQAIEAIKTAIATKPGKVRDVDIENEGGKIICEVEILGQDGRAYDVTVDIATNKVIKVEEDRDND
jgi:uncharacterized membrane protein YkoI